jgi:cytochrome P450
MATTAQQPLDSAFAEHLSAGGGADPLPLYQRLREEAPVFRTPSGFWFLTTHELAATYFRADTDGDSLWAKEAHNAGVGTDTGALTSGGGYGATFFANEVHHRDGANHARLRRVLNKPFRPRAIETLRATVQRVIAARLDELETLGSGADLVEHFAWRIPTKIIMDLLGVTDEHSALMVEIAESVIASHEPGNSTWVEKADAAFEKGHYLFAELIAERRRKPTDDMISLFANVASDAPDTISDVELTMNLMFLLVAGHETTANAIATAVSLLLSHPDQLLLLRNEPELLNTAVEESLRIRPPVRMSSPRWALADMELAGQQISRGDEVKVSIIAANRDPAVFADPNRFDIRREHNPHLSFALGSTHFCLGAGLARMEIQEALGQLLARFPRLEPLHEVRWRDSFVVQGPEELRLAW